MNRKLKIQPSLAGLTPDQLEQLADWLDNHWQGQSLDSFDSLLSICAPSRLCVFALKLLPQ